MWAMKLHVWSRGVTPYIKLGIRWRWVINFVPCPVYHWGDTCLYLLNMSNRAGLKCFAEQTNLSALLTVKQECVSHPACSVVTTLTVRSLVKHFKVACWQNFHHLLWFLWILGKIEALTYAVVTITCLFLSLCHSSDSSANAYGLLRVLVNQQKKDKILKADIDVKQ